MSKADYLDFENYLLIFFTILFAYVIYFFRSNSDETIGGAGKGLFFLLIGTSPLVCIMISIALVLVAWILIHALTKSSTPLLFLIGTFFIAVVLPIPAGPAEKDFYLHRSNYKAVVTLARQNKLEHANCGNAFYVPYEYQDWTDKCVSVNTETALVVEFSLPDSYHILAYVESAEALKATLSCYSDGYVFKKLEDQWYLCSPYSG